MSQNNAFVDPADLIPDPPYTQPRGPPPHGRRPHFGRTHQKPASFAWLSAKQALSEPHVGVATRRSLS